MIDVRSTTARFFAVCDALLSRTNATIVQRSVRGATRGVRAVQSRREEIRRRLQKETREIYTVQEWIGGGSMGDVFRARHKAMGTTAAIKVLNPDLASDATQLQRFLREAQIGATLQHPNIVWVIDYRQKMDFVYLVMNYVVGRSLETLMETHKRWEPSHVFALVTQVARALEAAHASKVIHRDLKPSNICVDQTGRVVVLDFGIAGLRTEARVGRTLPGQVLGTPLYMSPEQARGDPADERSDLYSLGVIMYELLAGENPFSAADPLSVLQRHISFSPPPLSQSRDDIPAPLSRAVQKLLSKDPRKRHQSAAELHDKLTEMANRPAKRKRKADGDLTPSALAELVTMESILHRAAHSAAARALTADEQAILDLCDGNRSIQQILDSAAIPVERAMVAIASLQRTESVYLEIPGIVPTVDEQSAPRRLTPRTVACGAGVAMAIGTVAAYFVLRGPTTPQAVQVDASPYATVMIRSKDGRLVIQDVTPLYISLEPSTYTVEFVYGEQRRVSTITVGAISPGLIREDFWESNRTRELIGTYR